MISGNLLQRFTLDAGEIDRRLRARVTPWELFSLMLAMSMAGIFVWLHATSPSFPYDYTNYVETARGDFGEYYYAYWLLPLFAGLNWLPGIAGYALWCLLNVAGVFFAARVFGGWAALALATYQMFYVLYYGQITGIIVGALALFWWGLAHRRWHVAGTGLALAASKYLTGLPIALFLWLLTGAPWRDRLRMLIIPAAVVAISLVVYPLWPLDVLATLQANPPNSQGNISLWQWVGPAATLVWLPPAVLPLSRGERLAALTAAMALALPYTQQTELLVLFVLPVGWPVLLGNLGVLFYVFGWGILPLLAAVPALVYALICGRALRRWLASRANRV